MEIPVIDFNELNDEKRSKTMELLHQACEKWGFFKVKKISSFYILYYTLNLISNLPFILMKFSIMQIENHGIDKELMEKVKHLVNSHYEKNLKERFYESETAKALENKGNNSDIDWESSFFIWHRPTSNIDEIPNLSEGLR